MNSDKSIAEESDGSLSSLYSRAAHYCVIQHAQARMQVYAQVKVCICVSPMHLCVSVHLLKPMCLCKPVCMCKCMHLTVPESMLTSLLHVCENFYVCACANQRVWKLCECVHKPVGKHKSIQIYVSLCVEIQAHKSVCRSYACKPCTSYAGLYACASLIIHLFASPLECACKPEYMLKSMYVSSVICVKSWVYAYVSLCVYL